MSLIWAGPTLPQQTTDDGEAGSLSGSEKCPSTPEKQKEKEEKSEEEKEEEKDEELEEKDEELEEKVEAGEKEKMVQPWNFRRNQGVYTIEDPTITCSSLGMDARRASSLRRMKYSSRGGHFSSE